MRRGVRLTMALLLLGASGAWGGGWVHCSTRWDAAFQRYVTGYTDGSHAVTKYDPQFQLWRTEIMKPGTVEKKGK